MVTFKTLFSTNARKKKKPQRVNKHAKRPLSLQKCNRQRASDFSNVAGIENIQFLVAVHVHDMDQWIRPAAISAAVPNANTIFVKVATVVGGACSNEIGSKRNEIYPFAQKTDRIACDHKIFCRRTIRTRAPYELGVCKSFFFPFQVQVRQFRVSRFQPQFLQFLFLVAHLRCENVHSVKRNRFHHKAVSHRPHGAHHLELQFKLKHLRVFTASNKVTPTLALVVRFQTTAKALNTTEMQNVGHLCLRNHILRVHEIRQLYSARIPRNVSNIKSYKRSPLKNSEVGPEEIVGCRHQYFENGGKSARRDDLFSIRACNTQVQARRPRRAAAGFKRLHGADLFSTSMHPPAAQITAVARQTCIHGTVNDAMEVLQDVQRPEIFRKHPSANDMGNTAH